MEKYKTFLIKWIQQRKVSKWMNGMKFFSARVTFCSIHFVRIVQSLKDPDLLGSCWRQNKKFLPNVACVGGVSAWFRSKQREVSESKWKSQVLALAPFFARQRPKIPLFVVLRSFFAPKQHGNTSYAGNTQCYMSSPLLFLSSCYTTTTNDFNSLPRTQPSTSFVYY